MGQEDRIRLPALNLIHRRSRLLDLLDDFVESGKRLITVYAPGGYGKSILLADFAQTTDLPVCWCSLEPTDRDPTSFLNLLAFSITDRFHEVEPNGLFDLIERGDTQNSIRRLAELLATVGPHLIVVDDYHKAVSAGMTLALNRLLDQLPDDSTMIVAARGDLALETGQIIDLLISERATGLSEEELRFTPGELQRVMRKRFGRRIDLEDAEEIARATDGNIAQILLAGHARHAEQMVGRLRQGLGDDRNIIYSFLAEDIFGKQPPVLQRFLLHTSVLPDMTAQVCNELLDTTDAQAHIEELVRRDLFIAQVGAGFRYHDLFAEFLRAKLAEDDQLHRQVTIKAAKLLAQQSRYEEAVNLFFSVQAWDESAALLESQGKFIYEAGRALTVNAWLEKISGDVLATYPHLLLLRGQILNSDLGDPRSAMDYFQRAEERFREQGDLISAAEAQVWQAFGLWMMGRANESIALADMGLKQLEALNADERIIAWAIKTRGSARSIAGDKPNALKDLRRALELFEALGDTHRVGSCHHEIGTCLDIQGNISAANYHFRQELRIWETVGNANQLANTLNSLGVTLYNVGRYDEALRNFNDCLDISLQIGATFRAALAQAGIGDVYLAQEKYKLAIEAYSVSTELAQRASAQPLEIYNLVKLGESFFQQNDFENALKLASQAMEIAAETGLVYEKGLASALRARVYVRRGEYGPSSKLFAKAVDSFANNDVLEKAKAKLWWGYSLLLDLRSLAAYEQVQEAIKLALDIGELIQGLGSTAMETKQLLIHFLHWPDTPDGMRDSIQLLLDQSQEAIDISAPSLQVFTFGTPYLIVAGKLRQFSQRGRVRKMPEFLAYLLVESRGSGCRWDEVSAKLWPEMEPDKASDIFHQTLKRLRNAIFEGSDYIIAQDDYYRVNRDYLDWCDALAFDRLYERAAQVPPNEALSLQLELISLYQGEFLAGFELSDWGNTYRMSFEARFLEIVNLATDQLLQKGEFQTALAVIHRGLYQDYFREELHRSAFKAYSRLGLYDQLEAHFSHTSQVFRREFDFPLDPETIQLYEQLMSER